MIRIDAETQIQQALQHFGNNPLKDSASALLDVLGYRSARTLALVPNTGAQFVATFGTGETFHPQARTDEWKSVDVLFQFTDSELSEGLSQQAELDLGGQATPRWDSGMFNSYLFLCIELNRAQYARGVLSGITRAVNKLFTMPVIVLYRHGPGLTLSVIHRRLNKLDANKDVLEKVTSIKDIRFAAPHRAHVAILRELSLKALRERYGFDNFDTLHRAWQKTLDISELNKRFYTQLSYWYYWAVKEVEFPKGGGAAAKTRNSVGVIRLLTRLIFIWFIKENGLVPETLFDPARLGNLLKSDPGGDPEGSNYFLGILQNLFFATLNVEMGTGRKWAAEGGGRKGDMLIHSLYRHKELFRKPDSALALFSEIPFLNGGLFECLDRELGEQDFERYPELRDLASAEGSGWVLRIDGFSRRPDAQPKVPNKVFFGGVADADLNADLGTRGRHYAVAGLLDLFGQYKFTVDENTPLEEEVALDPELLGKVFENLLASYNEDTKMTARKLSGSFYTPREVVDYMVDEAIIASLESSVGQTILSASSSVGQTILSAGLSEEQTGLSAPQFYDPSAETGKYSRRLPHWTQEGVIYWVTFRLADALPQEKLRQWQLERDLWLTHHPKPWNDQEAREYDERFGTRLESWLDAGYGECLLARPEVREIVQECVLGFDGERYDVHGCVIMPNHVHLLIRPYAGYTLSAIMKGLKGVSARKVNQRLERSGSFWFDESFDHIVRNENQFERFQQYIAENPVKAGLQPGTYWLYVEQTILSALPETAIRPDSQAVNTGASGKQTGLSASHLPGKQTGLSASRLRQLLAWNDLPHGFSPVEVAALIEAIDGLKILDPACGSGAFLMGMLTKLVHVLKKLDPENLLWQARNRAPLEAQRRAAGAIADPIQREAALETAEEELTKFERDFADRQHGDYPRKLHLIEKCIHGVDIQPIAVQIAKLRFFISLVVSQAPDRAKENCGIRALPNLETKIVAADTLASVLGEQRHLQWEVVTELEKELAAAGQHYFAARTTKTKRKWRDTIVGLRDQLADLLRQELGLPDAAARQLVQWNPFDQSAAAAFFECRNGCFNSHTALTSASGIRPMCARKKSSISSRNCNFTNAIPAPATCTCTSTSAPSGC